MAPCITIHGKIKDSTNGIHDYIVLWETTVSVNNIELVKDEDAYFAYMYSAAWRRKVKINEKEYNRLLEEMTGSSPDKEAEIKTLREKVQALEELVEKLSPHNNETAIDQLEV